VRLDHLLSTENSGRCLASGVGPAGDVPWFGPAGVEKIDDDCFAFVGGAGMLLGSRIATPAFCGCDSCLPLMACCCGLDAVVRGGLRTG
jgi:hypothetical protein